VPPPVRLGQQIEDAAEFMNKHQVELSRLADMSEVTDLRLDFGVSPKNGFLERSAWSVVAGE
jgi:hypothetical protein